MVQVESFGIMSLYINEPMCSSAARLNLVVAYLLCSIHYVFRNLTLFYSISCIQIKCGATISIQGQLYLSPNRQISVTIHLRVDVSNTAL